MSVRKVVLKLCNGLVLPDATKLLRAKFTAFQWDWYDGVATDPDSIEPVDFAITIAMNSRATADRMKQFMLRRNALDELLRRIPRDAKLGPDTPTGVFDAVSALFEEACKARGTKLSVTSKVMHRKRPGLIPMLDSVVVDGHYWPTVSSAAFRRPWFRPAWLKSGAWSDPTVYMRVMAEEIGKNRSSLALLRNQVADLVPTTISDVRLLEAALYAHLRS